MFRAWFALYMQGLTNVLQEWVLEAVHSIGHMPVSARMRLRSCANEQLTAHSLDWLPRQLQASKTVLFHVDTAGSGIMVDRYAERVRQLLLPSGEMVRKSFPAMQASDRLMDMRANMVWGICEIAGTDFYMDEQYQQRIRKCALEALEECKPIFGVVESAIHSRFHGSSY